MNCNCKTEVQEKLLARFKNDAAEATEHGVTLDGYTLMITGSALKLRSCTTVKQTARYPLKKGGTKVKTTALSMVHSFCPFCGVAAAQSKGGAA